MRQSVLFISFIILSISGKCQDMDAHVLDSLLANPEIIKLTISDPQPRLKEIVKLSMDINYLRAQVFKSELGKFNSPGGEVDESDFLITKVSATKKGKQTIGPLSFVMNGVTYRTNKIEYEVIEALPQVDKGVWIRKVMADDSTLCIIVEQRIPEKAKKTKINNNTTRFWAEPETNTSASMKSIPSIEGLEHHTSSGNSEEGYFLNDKGERLNYMYSYFIYYFKIIDKTKPIRIKKDQFINLPFDYKFEDIIIP